jgi:VIT1/CCC1 family predicted Fe2+/Mn2+ transporter
MSNSFRIHKKQYTLKSRSVLTRILDPIDRMEETVFSILIVLIFTLAYRAFALLPIHEDFFFTDAITIFRASLGAVIAWGLIDAIMYAIFSVFERKDRVRFMNELNASKTEQIGLEIIADEFDYIFDPITNDEQRMAIYEQVFAALKDMRPKKIQVEVDDLIGAGAIFMAAIVAVIPSLTPLVIIRGNLTLALRLSNLFSFLMLFITGYRWGKYSGYKPLLMGLIIMSIAALMVLLAIPLGG